MTSFFLDRTKPVIFEMLYLGYLKIEAETVAYLFKLLLQAVSHKHSTSFNKSKLLTAVSFVHFNWSSFIGIISM